MGLRVLGPVGPRHDASDRQEEGWENGVPGLMHVHVAVGPPQHSFENRRSPLQGGKGPTEAQRMGGNSAIPIGRNLIESDGGLN